MKTIFRFLFTLSLSVCISFNALAFNYYVTFSGASLDNVVVQNLNKGTQVTVPAGFQLRLYDVETSIELMNTITYFAGVYPNPMTDNATFSLLVKEEGNTQISVLGIDGRKIAGLNMHLMQGKSTFQLTLPRGIYLLQAKGSGFSYEKKIISLSLSDCKPGISLSALATVSKPQKAIKAEVQMQYSTGDQLLYKAYSGSNCTQTLDKPNESKTTDFEFAECKDADGNYYSIVKIGSQTWMVENLKTTLYRTGDEIGTTTSTSIPNDISSIYQWTYEEDERNADKFGRLYTWFAAVDSRNIAPEGWHVPTESEWGTLVTYMIANGYKYDGSTTKNKIAKALASTSDWGTSSYIGTVGNDLTKNNSSGFSATPAGFRNYDGLFNYIHRGTCWWSSTEYNSTNAWYRGESMDEFDLGLSHHFTKNIGLSVRCIKDETANPLNIETSIIPGGTFTMGSPDTEVSRKDEETQNAISLGDFRISKYEITNAQFAAFLNAKNIGSDGLYANGRYPTQVLIYDNILYLGLTYQNSQWTSVTGTENNPVNNVTWFGAAEYATYVEGALPTEAQWEYACRAGTTTPFNTGTCLSNLKANYRWEYPYSACINNVTTALNETFPVGSFAPNAYGLYDMHGNVMEWCADWYDIYPTSPPNDPIYEPTGAETGSTRVLRGGSWRNYAKSCRSANRFNESPDNYDSGIGFRVVFVP